MTTGMILSAATVEIMDVLLGLLILAGVAAIVVLIIFLVRLIGTMGRINRILEGVNEPVQATVKQLPETVKSLNNVMGNVQDMTDDVTVTLPALLNDVTETTDALKLTAASASLTISDLTELLSGGINFVRGKGRNVSKMTGIVRNVASAAGAYSGARRRMKRRR